MYEDVIEEYIVEFNGGSESESRQISQLEKSIVVTFQRLTAATQDAIKYHWDHVQIATDSNFKFEGVCCLVLRASSRKRAHGSLSLSCGLWPHFAENADLNCFGSLLRDWAFSIPSK